MERWNHDSNRPELSLATWERLVLAPLEELPEATAPQSERLAGAERLRRAIARESGDAGKADAADALRSTGGGRSHDHVRTLKRVEGAA